MKRKKCVRRYMARKMWGGFVSLLKALPLVLLLFGILLGVAYLEVCCPMAWAIVKWTFLALIGLIILSGVVLNAIDFYREARKECGYDRN